MHTTPVDAGLLERYDCRGPRYTSYPTAMEFSPSLGHGSHERLARSADHPERELSLYVHIPFCANVCFYCACNRIVTGNRARAGDYLRRLHREIEMQALLVDPSRGLRQMHWGGGTPTFLSASQMEQLMSVIGTHFQLMGDEEGEYSIEIDPREVDLRSVEQLRALGFNRLSLGVQDFDPTVQRAVNRVQPESLTRDVMDEARRCGFRSVSLDLIYGLPEQSVESFHATLEKTLELAPERLSVFSYAHLPERFKVQRRIDPVSLPSAATKIAILADTVRTLEAAGYVYIGMDHFALPTDSLAEAQRDGTLHRNFQGYSTHGQCDLIGCGVSAISSFAGGYSQNSSSLEEYLHRIDDGELPTARALELDADDHLRRAIIQQLICHFELELAPIESRFGIDFRSYFADALERLAAMEQDRLVSVSATRLRVLPLGRLLVRNVCMAFDRYRNHPPRLFSRTI